jgi:hypothetical protein
VLFFYLYVLKDVGFFFFFKGLGLGFTCLFL